MELKQHKSEITAWDGRWEHRLEIPVETELLIPDYLPAVFKIVKCLIEPVVLQNQVAAARWQGEGYLRCTVYYQSDEAGSHLYRAEQKFPFEKTLELPAGCYTEGPARLWGELEYCNCRAVSEHRIDLRGAYALNVAVEAAEQTELLSELSGCGMEQRLLPMTGMKRAAAEEKILTAETTVALSGLGETILDIGGTLEVQSCTLQTGQVNCAGMLRVQVCYVPVGSEEVMVRSVEIPVRQTLEATEVQETDQSCCWGTVQGATLAAGEQGDAVLTVNWKLHAEVWRSASYMAVADAYSTVCQTQTTMRELRLLQICEPLHETVSVTVEDDLPDEGQSINEVRACFVTLAAPLPTLQHDEGEPQQTVLQGKGTAHLLCADERGELTCYDKAFLWRLPDDWPGAPGEFVFHGQAALTRVSSGKNGTKLRVDLELSVTGLWLKTAQYTVVDAVELGEEFPDRGDGPALYLYYPAPKERIFDIAKRYHARAKDLAAANHLEAETGSVQDLTTEAHCLLIPAAL